MVCTEWLAHVFSPSGLIFDLCLNLQNVRAKSASPLRSASADMFFESSDDEIKVNGEQIEISCHKYFRDFRDLHH